MIGLPGRRRGEVASLIWFCAHGAALLALTVVTAAQGLVFWITGSALAVSSYAGQALLNRGPHRPARPR